MLCPFRAGKYYLLSARTVNQRKIFCKTTPLLIASLITSSHTRDTNRSPYSLMLACILVTKFTLNSNFGSQIKDY